MSDPKPHVIFSFDFEIGWGDVTNPNWRRRQASGVYKRLRSVLPEILAEMDALEIPASWATVGAMFDDPARRELEHLPQGARDIVHAVLEEAEPDSFDGRDLFEMVANANAGHRFASHSYSHVPFHYQGVDADFVRQDMKAFNRVLKSAGFETDRFVFPENVEGYENELQGAGIKVVRVAADTLFKNRWLYLATIAIVPPPRVKEITGSGGLTRHYGSMLFNDAGQSARIPLLNRRFALGLSAIRKKPAGFHVWSHPFNFAESEPLKTAFLATLRKVAALRDAGQLEIRTM